MDTEECRVDLYADPCCPFAWLAYRWMLEVSRERPIALRLRLMSLAMLNEHRDISPDYRELLAQTRGPGRVVAAAVAHHGPPAMAALYPAIARRIFVNGADHYQAIRDLPAVIGAALADAGLPTELAAAAGTDRYDAGLRASHDEGCGPLGEDAGTPILHVDGNAFFGPVLTSAPAGADAVSVFDAVRLLATGPHVIQIKRPMSARLDYGPACAVGS